MEFPTVGAWSRALRRGDQAEAAEAAAELEELGFGSIWFPDSGGPVFDVVRNLLGATRRTVVATGILNLWMHEPADVAASYASISTAYPDRFLMGIGVSHAPVIDSVRSPDIYKRPIASMSAFLDKLDAGVPNAGVPPVPVAGRVLAALGPKMLALAAERSLGVHPYLGTPEHTRLAREAMGEHRLVLPEQTVILCSSRDEAHAIGIDWLRKYLEFPNYANSMLRLGFSSDDVTTVSDKLFDALIVWGDEEAVRSRVAEHLAAGADQVCIQVLTGDDAMPRGQWRRLAAALV